MSAKVGCDMGAACEQAVKLVWHMQARYRLVPDLNTYNAVLQILAYRSSINTYMHAYIHIYIYIYIYI